MTKLKVFNTQHWPDDPNFKSHQFVDTSTFQLTCSRCMCIVKSSVNKDGKLEWFYWSDGRVSKITKDNQIKSCDEIMNAKHMHEALI